MKEISNIVIIGEDHDQLEAIRKKYGKRKAMKSLKRKHDAKHRLEDRGVPGTISPYCERKHFIEEDVTNWKAPLALKKLEFRAKRFGECGTNTGKKFHRYICRSYKKFVTHKILYNFELD